MIDSGDLFNKFSVLRIVKDFAPVTGGSVTHILELSTIINPYLRNQIIVAPYIQNCEDFDKKFPIPIVRVKSPFHSVGCPVIDDFFYSFYVMKVIRNILKKYEINIVHFHSTYLASYLIPQIRLHNSGLHYIVMAHGWYEKKSRHYGISYEIGKILIRFSSADQYLILDDGSQIFDLEEVLKKGNIPWDIVYHGIDTSLFRPNDDIDNRKRFTILYPHRPIPVKRPDIALKIFKKLSSKINDTTICLNYLAADHADDLKKLAFKEGLGNNVNFKKSLSGESMIHCINQSSVVIGTSLNSNTGRAIQEAMACAKPVIVFNNGGISNLITNMENGILVEPGDIVSFVDALELLYLNPPLRNEMGCKARETIIHERNWDKRIKKELSIYEQVCGCDD